MQMRASNFPRPFLAAALFFAVGMTSKAGSVVNFQDLSLAPNSYWSGPDLSGVHTAAWDDPIDKNYWVESWKGSFESGGLSFANTYTKFYDGPGGNLVYTSWSPFAYSNRTNTTLNDFSNQYSSFAGGGKDGPGDNFGLAFGYASTVNSSTIGDLPTLDLQGKTAAGLYITNTTYTALSMLEGDGWNQAFGFGDWFKLSIYGLDAGGNLLSTHVESLLADFTSTNSNDWYVLDTWRWVDLAPLAGAKSLVFNLTSSDSSPIWGMNTPGYFAFDNITFRSEAAVVPEPSSLALAGLGAALAGITIARRRQR